MITYHLVNILLIIIVFSDCKRVDKMLKRATDDNSARRLWEMSEDMVKLEAQFKLN